jgi:hypothetical protein
MPTPPRTGRRWNSISSSVTSPRGVMPSNVAALITRLRSSTGPSRAGPNTSAAATALTACPDRGSPRRPALRRRPRQCPRRPPARLPGLRPCRRVEHSAGNDSRRTEPTTEQIRPRSVCLDPGGQAGMATTRSSAGRAYLGTNATTGRSACMNIRTRPAVAKSASAQRERLSARGSHRTGASVRRCVLRCSQRKRRIIDLKLFELVTIARLSRHATARSAMAQLYGSSSDRAHCPAGITAPDGDLAGRLGWLAASLPDPPRRAGRIGDHRWLDRPPRDHRALLRSCPRQSAGRPRPRGGPRRAAAQGQPSRRAGQALVPGRPAKRRAPTSGPALANRSPGIVRSGQCPMTGGGVAVR